MLVFFVGFGRCNVENAVEIKESFARERRFWWSEVKNDE
jgi:hypothetical protein